MAIEKYFFRLPQRLIPQRLYTKDPRLLIARENNLVHSRLSYLKDYLFEGDVLIFNDTEVIPTRLWSVKENSGEVEVNFITKIKDNLWEVLIRPDFNIINNSFIYFEDKSKGKIVKKIKNRYLLRLFYKGNFMELLKRNAFINLPFYLSNNITLKDYQTAYANKEGSAQPPTAGFYFTRPFLNKLSKQRINIGFITLHIGASILSSDIKDERDLRINKEYYIISKKTAQLINRSRKLGRRIIAVGTSVVRVLETIKRNNGLAQAGKGWTNLTIKPGYKFRVIDGLLTNFHQPCSSHLLLTSAFLGDKDSRIINIYKEAIKSGYRFLDFGDKILILK